MLQLIPVVPVYLFSINGVGLSVSLWILLSLCQIGLTCGCEQVQGLSKFSQASWLLYVAYSNCAVCKNKHRTDRNEHKYKPVCDFLTLNTFVSELYSPCLDSTPAAAAAVTQTETTCRRHGFHRNAASQQINLTIGHKHRHPYHF